MSRIWTDYLVATQFTRYLRLENGILKEMTLGVKGY
jgi:hypothetical protein